jgi:putative nucleotidyltransferase with HDIG domain
MTRQEAFDILQKNLSSSNLIKHSLAVEAVMRKLANYFDQDCEQWGITGLLHDIDYERTKDNPRQHSLVGAEMIQEMGLDAETVQAVKVHNEIHGIKPESLMGKALFCIDSLTGLIVASVLVLPSRKISDLTVDSVLKHFQQKSFARGVNRENIDKSKEYLGLDRKELVILALLAMQEISTELAL